MKATKQRSQQRRERKKAQAAKRPRKTYTPTIRMSGMTLGPNMLKAMYDKCLRVEFLAEYRLREGLTQDEMLELTDYFNLIIVSAKHRSDTFDQEAFEEFSKVFIPGCEAIEQVMARVRKNYHGQPKESLRYVCTAAQLQAILDAVEMIGIFVRETLEVCPAMFLKEAWALAGLYNQQGKDCKPITPESIDREIKKKRSIGVITFFDAIGERA